MLAALFHLEVQVRRIRDCKAQARITSEIARALLAGEFKEGETPEGWIAARLDQERQKRKGDGFL
jgi:hypothetical protein